MSPVYIEKAREDLCPAITADNWDAALKRNGFAGADVVMKDFEDDVIVLSSETYPVRSALFLQQCLGLDAQMVDVERAALVYQRDDNELVILMVDCGGYFLHYMNADPYAGLKSLVRASRRILWVFGSGAWDVGRGHGLLPTGLDFFILMSFMMGINGGVLSQGVFSAFLGP
ncbi:hypothetical protein CP532_5123 [Ophiocordyceps camponoti-leonardi (nom. inval.)]|nr:hypothetical protein CP532_5123 [Ophiocordyceps camponoti-leonardi (nom. inval.)]